MRQEALGSLERFLGKGRAYRMHKPCKTTKKTSNEFVSKDSSEGVTFQHPVKKAMANLCILRPCEFVKRYRFLSLFFTFLACPETFCKLVWYS